MPPVNARPQKDKHARFFCEMPSVSSRAQASKLNIKPFNGYLRWQLFTYAWSLTE